MTFGQVQEEKRLQKMDETAVLKAIIIDLETRLYKSQALCEYIEAERDQFMQLSQKQGAQLEALLGKLAEATKQIPENPTSPGQESEPSPTSTNCGFNGASQMSGYRAGGGVDVVK